MNLPFRRQEYYAVKGVRWSFETEVWRQDANGQGDTTSLVDSVPTAYPAGRTTPVRWQQAVFGPSLPDSRAGVPASDPQSWVFRDGDSLTVAVPMYADGGRDRLGLAVVDSEHTSLSRNGVAVGASDALGQQVFALPAGQAQYVLTKTVRRPAELYQLSTEIESAWTFRSERTPDGKATPQPLMTVRYEPALDERNQAPAGRFDVPVTVEHRYGVVPRAVVSLTIEASYDGSTWHPLAVRRSDHGWVAETDQPGGSLVSLRAHAVDSAGNAVEQTIHNAYSVR